MNMRTRRFRINPDFIELKKRGEGSNELVLVQMCGDERHECVIEMPLIFIPMLARPLHELMQYEESKIASARAALRGD